jgi:sugar lactone lactonase YvrE
VQQGVQRGSQPWYYYLLVLTPVYEFLPFMGALLALALGIRRVRMGAAAIGPGAEPESVENSNFPNTFPLLLWWIVASYVAFSIAGEKMPWLTYHLAWPLILLAAWGLGRTIEHTDWQKLRERRAPLVLGSTFVFLTSFAACIHAAIGSNPPFQGQSLEQLQASSAFLLPALAAAGSAVALMYLLRDWAVRQAARTATLSFFAITAVLTIRSAVRAAYVNYDNALEYLVYAHASTAVKDVIQQATEISQRTTGGMGIDIAYDASSPDTGVSWPFVWYLRNFTNQHSFDQPTRALRESTVVIVDAKNFDKIEQALGPGYYRVDYIRMWWPNQDYFGLVSDREPVAFDDSYSCKGVLSFLRLFRTRDFSRVCSALADPKIRGGIIDIWLNRDYTAYAAATGHADMTLATWQPSDQMRMYIKKDVAQQMWKYGAAPATNQVTEIDPYQGKTITLAADAIIDSGSVTPAMNAPRSMAFAPDGSLYVTDSRNHRILHFGATGTLLGQWGSPTGNSLNSPNPMAPPSSFNEPWGVAVGPDGSVYVSDTWNYRIQKFTADGKFLTMWSSFGPAGQQEAFYGPRGITVDASGHVYVVDTGNKRIVIFDSDGVYLTDFGGAGLDPGQFDEPVGIAIDGQGVVYVTDTWNQRMQSFVPSNDGLTFTPLKQWDVVGWTGQSLENKPFLALDHTGHVFVTDPEASRVIEYTTDGQLVRTWGDYGSDPTTFGVTSGIAVDANGSVWVSDAGNNRVMKFTLP